MKPRAALVAVLLALSTSSVGCISGTIISAVRGWLGSRETHCDDYCALDSDGTCGGASPDLATCIAACNATDSPAPCGPTRRVLEDCESRMSCAEFSDRHRPNGPCDAERAAQWECLSDAEGPK